MKNWKSINDKSSWLFTEKFITAIGKGVGIYNTSYAVNTNEGEFLNGKISARIKIRNWRSCGAGLICRADEFGSFICLFTSPEESSTDYVTLRLGVFINYFFQPIISLKKKVRLDEGYNLFELEFISGEINGKISTSNDNYIVSFCVPHIPFPGHTGIVKFYNAGITVRDFTASKYKFQKRKNKITMKKYTYDVFLSHSSKDKVLINEVVSKLKSDGVSVWVDDEQINFGDNITDKIEDGLKNSKYIVVALSKNLGKSNWCRAEYGPILNREYSGNSDKRVIPLKLDDCADNEIPILLYDKSRADYRNKAEFERFIKFLKM